MNNQNNKIVYGIGGIIIGILLVLVFTPMMRYGGFGMMNWGNGPITDQRVNGNTQLAGTIDKHFIEQMIPHHEGAIAMANLALQKAKHPEIKTLATAIIAAQTKEIQSMNGWYQDWFGTSVPKVSTGMMGGGTMSSSGMHFSGQEDMTALENASDFDKAFIEEMIPHHQLAIMMANMLQSGTNRPEMQQLAKNIISSQSKEIQQMQAWYVQWYK
ncbi:hypothetical protein A2419_01485 [Candidatus Adlerbacteria bacterium RIFOXYC1_FULL_48_26]|uniref:DUF305 domain-containing protein n=1 Tax=Candidatus Adlerbacteria bacterium RIFOXYC1_FULL_48_26 TaxID=1797247 RepID=A0A1F4Y2N4_9BACT|nr:MAG: hypothetical protein A2419_01485 [Candidatus Adlerbacteria bacterium RIFOXYC1_FULL_48_26]OGC93951.1 MAG: hypothetical protein A2389_00450 [Candidatus Adlerbacteria bacterium RIFOXYB1_FULL_48_10]OGC96051.1 MAG: hypothetical protein A2590_01675 [Candidatus Adlerbacteria bacterium RIFOXYD1_FULL_48_8]